MKTRINISLILLLVSFTQLRAQDSTSAYVDSASNKIDLKVNLTPTSTYHFVNDIKQKITQELLGSQIEMAQNIHFAFDYEVISNDGANTKIKVTYKKITLDMQMPQGAVKFDSEENESDSASSPLREMIDRPLFIYLNDQGKIENVEGLTTITTDRDNVEQSIIHQLANENNIISLLNATFNIFPDHPIEIGDSWQKENHQSVNNQFDFNNAVTLTLESLNEDLAWINMEGEITSSADGHENSGKAQLSGTQHGTYEVDRPSGLILSNNTHQEIDGKWKTQGLDVSLKIVSESSLKGEKR